MQYNLGLVLSAKMEELDHYDELTTRNTKEGTLGFPPIAEEHGVYEYSTITMESEAPEIQPVSRKKPHFYVIFFVLLFT